MPDTTPNTEQHTELSFFQRRMNDLGVTPENNKISLHKTELGTGKPIQEEVPIFSEVPDGIKIICYSLDRHAITIEKHGSRMKENFSITRLEHPVEKNGSVMKYRIPKGAGTFPFFPPGIIEKFEKKIPMKTVFITEGYFKAYKGYLSGVDVIGLSSITHMKDKNTLKLHDDIITLIKSGLVERFVWLTDGDCLDISKEITPDKDLARRPKNFLSSISTFKTLLEDFDVEKWFMHIDVDQILTSRKDLNRDDVKGLDDLLITLSAEMESIITEMHTFSGHTKYFTRFNVTFGMAAVWRYFHLGNVNDFYHFHVERRKDLAGKEFKYEGTRYRYNEEKSVCEILIPADASLYFRVGDDYYKWVEKPNQYGKKERVMMTRQKSTISDDHGKGFTKYIAKYEAFCNVPDHANFQQVLYNCFNVYCPLDYQPDEDECSEAEFPNIMNMVKHIFGEKKTAYTDKERIRHDYAMYELGLDYLQMLYLHPQQKLPILCLVSKENNTGKSTMGYFLREMLGANVAIVGNSDIANDFNAHWVTKSVVVIDEAKVDKHSVVEKIKALSTARKVYMNAKGKGQVELDCFIKFIFITNNEDNFIYANDEDQRYWVLKVPQLTEDDPDMQQKTVEEIPAFLSWLGRRKMVTERRSRMWFHPELLKTEALRKVIQFSQPTIEKELRAYFKELFLDTGLDEIMMNLQAVHKEVFNNRFERNYLSNILHDRIRVKPFHVFNVEGVMDGDKEREYSTEEEALAAAQIKYSDIQGHMLLAKIKSVSKVIRYSYPRYEEITKDGNRVRERIEVKEPPGRPFVFRRKMFVDDTSVVIMSQESKFINETVSTGAEEKFNPVQEDLPFPTN